MATIQSLTFTLISSWLLNFFPFGGTLVINIIIVVGVPAHSVQQQHLLFFAAVDKVVPDLQDVNTISHTPCKASCVTLGGYEWTIHSVAAEIDSGANKVCPTQATGEFKLFKDSKPLSVPSICPEVQTLMPKMLEPTKMRTTSNP